MASGPALELVRVAPITWKLFMHEPLVLDQVKAAETVYFLVAATPGWVAHNDFYVLPLTKQEDIDHARYLISRWQSGYLEADRPLVLAAVGPGNDAINRNYRDSRFPE